MVTITDIAASLGVTPSTVSRALAGSSRVKESTRLAVEKRAAEMGYERNVVASNLRKGRSNMVGIVVPRIHREFFSNVIGGAESVLNQAGYNVIICQTMESLDAEIMALKALRNYRVAAVFLSHAIECKNGSHVREVLGNDLPLVQFDRVFPDLPGAKIVGANCEGAFTATKHLISQGYKRIGTIAGFMTSQAFVERLAGYRLALESAGMNFDPSIVFEDSIVRETGYEACKKALEDNREKLLYYPAASRNHHAELGGLLYHTKRMLMNGERVCEVYTNLKRDLVVAGVIMHDMQKLFEIDATLQNIVSNGGDGGRNLDLLDVKTL